MYNQSFIELNRKECDFMARQPTKYTCTVEYTEGCSQRLTQALVDIYYNRLKGIREAPDQSAEETQETQAPA